jgi:predicted site-specific integrase-resolvase
LISLYTYVDMAQLFKVKVTTIRNWQSQGLFKVMGYRRLGKWAKEAIVSEEEVKLLIKKKYVQGR